MALLRDKVAAVTGGVTGIGRAIVLGFLSQGAKIAVNHLDNADSKEHFNSLLKEATRLYGSGLLISLPGDISKPEIGTQLVEETVKAFGKIDILVSNAGICEFADFLSSVSVMSEFQFSASKLNKY